MEVSILIAFPKILRISHEITSDIDKYLSPLFLRKSYNTQRVITRMVEDWKEKLDHELYVRLLLTDLPKALDSIIRDLIIPKRAAYGLDNSFLLYIYSYVQNVKQCFRINNTQSSFENATSGVPQGSILGHILFNLLTVLLITTF